MTTPYLPLPGASPLWLAHLKAFGFRQVADTGTLEWGTPDKFVLVRPSGHMTWYVITGESVNAEVRTIGQFRQCIAGFGIEPWF